MLKENKLSRFYYGWVVIGIVFLTLLVSAGISSFPSVLIQSLEKSSAGREHPFQESFPFVFYYMALLVRSRPRCWLNSEFGEQWFCYYTHVDLIRAHAVHNGSLAADAVVGSAGRT